MIPILKKMVRNHQALLQHGCTEMAEYMLGLFYLWWAITVDPNSAPFYAWMTHPSPIFWRTLAGCIALFRLLTVLLGGKGIRMLAAFAQFGFSITAAFGFLSAGFYAGGGHLIFASLSLWAAWRINARINEEGNYEE